MFAGPDTGEMNAQPAFRLSLASLLLLTAAPALADSPWDCQPGNTGVWECTSKTPLPTAPVQTPTADINSPADTTATDATADELPGATLPAAPAVAEHPAAEVPPESAAPAPAPVTPAAAVVTPAVQPATSTLQPAEQTTGKPASDRVEVMQPTEPTQATPAQAITAAGALSTEAVQPAVITPVKHATTRTENARQAQCPPAELPGHLAAIDDPDAIDLHADHIHANRERVFTLDGNAVIRYQQQQLEAGNIIYRHQSGEAEATDGIRFSGPSLVVTADSAHLQTQSEQGQLYNIDYVIPGQNSRGTARVLAFDGAKKQLLKDGTYTTCPPGSNDWQLVARKVELDQTDGIGIAHGAKLTFKDVPLLYTPYISFPLDDRRKTGLLVPKVGTTDETGLDISIPWYWNIATNVDATLTPRVMSDRGVMLGGEVRYLKRNSTGKISGEFLSSDKEFRDENRNLVSVQHKWTPTPRLTTRIKASNVSDTQYFEDLGNSLVQTSQTSLERTAQATYHGDWWQLGINAQDFQNIDETLTSAERPYKQLPQILFNAAPARRILGLQAGADVELNYFKHSDNTLVKGTRVDIMPRVSLPLKRPGWHIEPAVAVRHTAYNLDNAGAGAHTDPTRTLPVVSLDAGSIFERDGHWGNTTFIQTLEPRLFYLYVPNKNQDDLPIFDTENFDQNFWSLFRENRFSGPDRMGDANQLAVALTTRIINPASGRQMLSASLGSLLYFRDRTITLPGETVATDSSSDLISEIDIALSRRWSARGEAHWNPHTEQSNRSNVLLRYRAGPRKLVNLGYRLRRGIQEQADFSFLWPFSRSWHAVGRWYYALDNNETIEALAGLGYERCCWGLQILARSYINSDSRARNNAIFVQLELKGLGKLGTNVDGALERGILGYRSNN